MSTSGDTGLGTRNDGWDGDRERDRDDDDREITVYERSEARRSPSTSEFWIFIVVTAALLAFTYLDSGDSLSREEGWRYAAAITVAYLISRGLAKAGSSEPVVRQHRI
jgi:hypothetical protein